MQFGFHCVAPWGPSLSDYAIKHLFMCVKFEFFHISLVFFVVKIFFSKGFCSGYFVGRCLLGLMLSIPFGKYAYICKVNKNVTYIET